MQHKLTRLEYLKQTIADLHDDPARPWTDYPCLEWPYYRDPDGYGVIAVCNVNGRSNIRVNKFAIELELGVLPDGYGGLHHCDNPACFRPNHLFSGTQRQNMLDMRIKGRAAWRRPRPRLAADRNHKSKLTWGQVQEIRSAYNSGVSQPRLAIQFGLHQTAISHIIRGTTWKDPSYIRPLLQNRQRAETSWHSRFKWCEVEEIRRLRSLGVSQYKLAKMFLASTSHIHGIVHGTYWKSPVAPTPIVQSIPAIIEAHTEAQWRDLCAAFNHICVCCLRPLPLTRDHVIPFGWPGHSDLIENIQPLCSSCNARKGNRRATDYRLVISKETPVAK